MSLSKSGQSSWIDQNLHIKPMKIKSYIAFVVVLCFSTNLFADLVGHWKLDEGTGRTTADEVAGNDLEFRPDPGGPVWSDAELPLVGSGTQFSVKFNGTTDQLVAPGYKVPEIDGTNPRTIAAWVKAAPGAAFNMGIVAYGRGSGWRQMDPSSSEREWNNRRKPEGGSQWRLHRRHYSDH